MLTHLIGNFARGGTRTLCGRLFQQDEIARNGDPSCPECQRIDEADAASLLALRQDTTAAPHVRLNDRDLYAEAGYAPRGSRR